MFDCVKYVNHLNQEINFGSGEYFLNESELRDFEWNYNTAFNRITNINRKGVVTKPIPIIIHSRDGVGAKNRLFEIFERDVIARTPGRFYIGDYFCEGYVLESKKENYLLNKNLLVLEVTFVTEKAYWIRPTVSTFAKYTEAQTGDYILDYPHDYGYDYYDTGLASVFINNEHFDGSEFRLLINGQANFPRLEIGSHVYEVEHEVKTGEVLEINSKDRTISLIQADGCKENLFNYRNKDYNIFQKVPPGVSTVFWDGKFEFELTLFEERSEPKWT